MTKKTAAKKKAGTELAERKNTELAVPMEDMAADAGMGMENVGREDLAIPFFRILQALSPQVNRRESEYIEGAEAGMFYNTVTKELFDGEDGMIVVPVFYQRTLMEWNKREDGGGLVAIHPVSSDILSSCTKDDRGRDITPQGTQIVNTAQYYVMLVRPDGTYERGIISMASTQLKKARQWNSIASNILGTKADGEKFTMPLFSQYYRITTVPESNDQGSWYGYKIVHEGQIDNAQLYQNAKEFVKSIRAGEVKAKDDTTTTDAPAY